MNKNLIFIVMNQFTKYYQQMIKEEYWTKMKKYMIMLIV